MTGFEPRTSGIGSDRSTNWATQPLPEKSLSFYVHFDLSLSLSLLFQSILFGLTIKFAPNCLSSIFFRSFWPFSLSLLFHSFPFSLSPFIRLSLLNALIGFDIWRNNNSWVNFFFILKHPVFESTLTMHLHFKCYSTFARVRPKVNITTFYHR